MPIWRKEHELARVSVHWLGIIMCAISVALLCSTIGGERQFLERWFAVGILGTLSGVAFFLVSRGEAHHDDGKA